VSPSKGLSGYLTKYAEPESMGLEGPGKHWRHCVAIPACAEGKGFAKTLESLAHIENIQSTLLVLVVNGADSSPASHHEKNAEFLNWIRGLTGCGNSRVSWGRYAEMDICLVDRCSPGRRLPSGQGVGLARKISADIPAALFLEGRLTTPWVHTTDADVELPADYLSRVPDGGDYSAALHPYKHMLEGDPSQELAMLQYESYLHFYTLGLIHASSPYAYTAIGSTIALHLEYYAAVRGFPKRQAGEDFYLLNKLAKVGTVTKLSGAPIRVRGRFSDRVPFGTGAALLKITGERSIGEGYTMYDPRSFEVLGAFLRAWESFSNHASFSRFREELEELESCWPGLESVIANSGVLKMGEQVVGQVKAGPPLRRRLMEWMDAFRTLKFMHGVREHMFSELPWKEAIEQSSFCSVGLKNSPRELCDALGEEIIRKENGSIVTVRPRSTENEKEE